MTGNTVQHLALIYRGNTSIIATRLPGNTPGFSLEYAELSVSRAAIDCCDIASTFFGLCVQSERKRIGESRKSAYLFDHKVYRVGHFAIEVSSGEVAENDALESKLGHPTEPATFWM